MSYDQALAELLPALIDAGRWEDAIAAVEACFDEEPWPPLEVFGAMALAYRGLECIREATIWSAVWYGGTEEPRAAVVLGELCQEWPELGPPWAPLLGRAWRRVAEFGPLSRGLEALLEQVGDRPGALEIEAFMAALGAHRSYDRETQAAALPRLQRLQERFPEVKDLWMASAWARAETGDLQGAEADLRSALAISQGPLSIEAEAVSAAASCFHLPQSWPLNDEFIWDHLCYLYESRGLDADLERVTRERLGA
ncbi:MAG: tetratricopeptide repeat protein [Myxococcales bacterium]|nr:tetratricopeptide repeat protein [Myxococcales bacterium]